MSQTLCPCCKIFGKPSHQVNLIVVGHLPYSAVHERIKCLLKYSSEINSFASDRSLPTYKSWIHGSKNLFKSPNNVSVTDQPEVDPDHNCCNGLKTMSVDLDESSSSSEVDEFQNRLTGLFATTDDEKLASWVLIYAVKFFDQRLLNMLGEFNNKNPSSISFTLTIACFLGDEQQLFENWLCESQCIDDYNLTVFPNWDQQVKNFFALLNTSKYLQANTLLINEQTILVNDSLKKLMQCIFNNKSSEYRAQIKELRSRMERLLSRRRRTARDIHYVRKKLLRLYNQRAQDRLTPILEEFHRAETVANAARQIVQMYHYELSCYNGEELRIYKRHLLLGSVNGSIKRGNTIIVQLIHYALRLLENRDMNLTPLLCEIIVVIYNLSSHFFFRHELFHHTPEIYKLSLLLVAHREYVLTLAGLNLCATILNADGDEHKYALTFMTHDHLAARKMLDAIKWLLTPFQELNNQWNHEKQERLRETKEEDDDDKKNNISESSDDSKTYEMERLCFHHASILHKRLLIRSISSLFYASVDHCLIVKEEDVSFLTEIICVLIDNRMIRWMASATKLRYSILLMSDICSLLAPILLYSSPSVSSKLQSETRLLPSISKGIDYLLRMESITEKTRNVAINFYTELIQSKCKSITSNGDDGNDKDNKNDDDEDDDDEDDDDEDDDDDDDDSDDDDNDNNNDDTKRNGSVSTHTAEDNATSSVPLTLSNDLISAYFNLYREIRGTRLLDNTPWQEEIQTLMSEEWKTIDVIKLQHDYKQLQLEKQSLKDELTKLEEKLQRTQLDRDQIREENMRLSKEVNTLKQRSMLNSTTDASSLPTILSCDSTKQENTVDLLQNVSPDAITKEQAQKCVQEIYHRRTTFNDDDMRKSICGSLKNLGSDLYSSPVHFLHELIQNAEDNFYSDSIAPCLRIELNRSYILLSNNEKGLRAKDIAAICSLSVTTKSNLEAHIGEKGVGFKSVFAASDEPMLISHAWKFRFSVKLSDPMSYITPLWIADEDIPDCISNHISTNPQHTHLYLPLKFGVDTNEANELLSKVIEAVDPCILLNMRHLQKLEINDKRHNQVTLIEKHRLGPTQLQSQVNVDFEGFTFFNLTGSVLQLHTSSSSNTFRVYTCDINVVKTDERRSSEKTRLILGFPCEKHYHLTSTVYAGLPVCDLGFNFLFNADFQLVTNREKVRENVPFNASIRDHLSALFVYILLNDVDLRPLMHHYCPSSDKNKDNNSSWWNIMIDNINRFIQKYLLILLGIKEGKLIRSLNKELSLLISNEQLSNYANVHVIDVENSFLTVEQLKSLQIESVSIVDVLDCFPDREEATITNNPRAQFRQWTKQQDHQWWSRFFHHLAEAMTLDISSKILRKPIFLLSNDHLRQYLPEIDKSKLLLFISDDPCFEMWKQNLTLLRYSCEAEKEALLKSTFVQHLTDQRMIDIIRQSHLEIATKAALNTSVNTELRNEIWKDLFYLRSHIDLLKTSTPFLVPVNSSQALFPIQHTTLPSILGVDMRRFIYQVNLAVIDFPYYYHAEQDKLLDILQWEHFLLHMNCQKPYISLPPNYSVVTLPLLPALTRFASSMYSDFAEKIFSHQTECSKECLRQFPIVDNERQQVSPVSANFDEAIVQDLPSLPHITVPSHCRSLAKELGICVEYDLMTSVKILKLLSAEKNTNVNLYFKWLSHLQLYIHQRHDDDTDLEDLLKSCSIYLPDQKDFSSIKRVLIISDHDNHYNDILATCKYFQFQIISQSHNRIYWPLKDLFERLGCISLSKISVAHICSAIHRATRDKSNFLSVGDCCTTLTEHGVQALMILYPYLEELMLDCVQKQANDTNLYTSIVTNKHLKAPSGSPEDLKWRFSFTCNSLSQELKRVSGIQKHRNKIGLLTIENKIVVNTSRLIVYANFELTLAREVSRDIGKRHFVLLSLAKSCPLVLAALDADYVERRSILQWKHINQNLEYKLQHLTDIFCETLHDSNIEVIISKYANITMFLSDAREFDPNVDRNYDNADSYWINHRYPFWILKNTVILCRGESKTDASTEISAISALATLLHKRNHESLEDAKSIAQRNIGKCTCFRSDTVASVAGTGLNIYLCTDVLFPVDHHYIETITISVGKNYAVERDQEQSQDDSNVPVRRVEDQMLRIRAQELDHRRQNVDTPIPWKDSRILDSIEHIRIGQNAEHFFFAYLQKYYGTNDVTPTRNWRSSSRLAVYPQYPTNIDDSAGYDFELKDTLQVFSFESVSTTKHCYFEVKGTSGSFSKEHTRFNITKNELNTCESIAHNWITQQSTAYFIVIIQHCLDWEKISFGTVINWSENFNIVKQVPDTYLCQIVVPRAAAYQSATESNANPANKNRQQPPWRNHDRDESQNTPQTRTTTERSTLETQSPRNQNQQQYPSSSGNWRRNADKR